MELATTENAGKESLKTNLAARSGSPLNSPRVCFAASGGGHVRQLLDLEGVWNRHKHFFVTEDTPLARSIAKKHETYFVSHVALGQARLGFPIRMFKLAVRNCFESLKIVLSQKPDVVISTGAGAVFFTLAWARLLGAKIVMIESFARFDNPSVFARIAAPLSHQRVVQSASLASRIKGAKVFDPLRILDEPRTPKKSLLFVTVGATLPFNRLVEAVAVLKLEGRVPEKVIIQTGVGGSRPIGFETYETLDFERQQSFLREADIVVCHGGTGSLITALRHGCRVIVMPRLFENGEHYDDHQVEICRAFERRGLVVVANSKKELLSALDVARARTPLVATTDASELVVHLNGLLSQWQDR